MTINLNDVEKYVLLRNGRKAEIIGRPSFSTLHGNGEKINPFVGAILNNKGNRFRGCTRWWNEDGSGFGLEEGTITEDDVVKILKS